jgi:CRP-like cAMP-binding protein
VGLTPSLRAIPGYAPGDQQAKPILTKAQRARVAALATRVDLGPRAIVFRAGTPAEYVFVNGSGVIKAFSDLPSGKQRIVAFWFPGDLFGLAEQGKFVYSTQTVSAVTLYRIPAASLRQALLKDGRLQFQFLLKITHEYRKVQRQKVALTRRDAVGKVATFFGFLEQQADGTNVAADTIAVPMGRADIASFLGLSAEAVSRATRELQRRRLVAFPDPHTVRILDRVRFQLLVAKI